MPTLLFIVSRRQPELCEYLRRQFASEPDMMVMLDRRTAERRRRRDVRPAYERRQGDRRQNYAAAQQLLTMGYTFARPLATAS
jgi:hypothetical protein